MDIKEIITTKILYDIKTECPNVDIYKVQFILDKHLQNCNIEKIGTEIVVASMVEQIKIYIANKCIRGMSQRTIKEYCYILRSFDEYMHKPIELITSNDIRMYMSHLMFEKKLKNVSVANKIGVVKNFFNFVFNEKIISENPAVNVANVKVNKKNVARKPLSLEQLEILRNSCKNIYERALLEFLYSTGCRIGELENIDIRSIDWEQQRVDVLGKGNVIRTVMFSVKCRLYLKEYLQTRKGESNILFIGQRAPYKALKRDGMRAAIKRIAARTEIQRHVFPHLLRHTFATNALYAGMDITQIQKLLGHMQIDTTMVYAEVNYSAVGYNYNRLIG